MNAKPKPSILFVYFGLKIPPTNLQEHHLEQARGFADALADRLPKAATVAT